MVRLIVGPQRRRLVRPLPLAGGLAQDGAQRGDIAVAGGWRLRVCLDELGDAVAGDRLEDEAAEMQRPEGDMPCVLPDARLVLGLQKKATSCLIAGTCSAFSELRLSTQPGLQRVVQFLRRDSVRRASRASNSVAAIGMADVDPPDPAALADGHESLLSAAPAGRAVSRARERPARSAGQIRQTRPTLNAGISRRCTAAQRVRYSTLSRPAASDSVRARSVMLLELSLRNSLDHRKPRLQVQQILVLRARS